MTAYSIGKGTPLNSAGELEAALRHIGETSAADRIGEAITKVLASGPEHRTRDIGGTGTTAAFTAAMCDRLRKGTRAGD